MNTSKIRSLNDKLRQNILSPSGLGKVIMTAGVSSMSYMDLFALVKAIARFNGFNEDNDPYGEHEFGALDFKGERYFFKIDYYDRNLMVHSENPADPNVTCRVFTIMRADEY